MSVVSLGYKRVDKLVVTKDLLLVAEMVGCLVGL